MKLIHCADIHLDSPLSKLSSDLAKQRRAEILATFCRMIDYAAANGVEAVLIAGDLFDSEKNVRKRTKSLVREAVAKYPDLQFYYLAGNHDGGTSLYDEENPAPDNFHTFGKRWKTYRVGEIAITASERPNADTLSLDPADINFVMLHGQTVDASSVSARDDIPLRAYAKKNVDYLALGHIHSYQQSKVDGRCIACYCGCLEGRGFDECGKKGFLLLETTPDRRVEQRFVPFARRTLHEVRLDVSGCTSQAELDRRADDAIADIPKDDLVKLTAVGSLDPDFNPEYHWIEEKLNERFFYAKRKDETTLLIRPEDYRNDISLKGEFIRRVMASDLPPADRDRVILNGLRALWGEELDL
ncbi:MAG: DNA repair exonuclease [Clostridia bacterium]|nr:DNA repair exonuclease [Clostridia bacterium]